MGKKRNCVRMADDLDFYERWLKKQEVRFSQGELSKPSSIVEACQWMSSTKKLKEEFDTREKPLITAIELGAELPEIIALQERSRVIKGKIDMYLAKVEALCVLLANGKNNCDAEKIVTALSSSGAKLGIQNEKIVEGVSELQSIL